MYMGIIRKLLFIMSIIILSSNAFAEKCSGFSNSFSITNDVGFGDTYRKSPVNEFKKHGVCIVNKSEEHPTRLGEQALRFEVKPGDCGYSRSWSDCKNDRERHELKGHNHQGENWYMWSVFLPKNFQNVYPTKLSFFQFKQIKNGKPVWMIQNYNGGFHIDNQVNGYSTLPMGIIILEAKETINKWNDMVVNSNWTVSKDGFFRLWVNGKLILNHSGPTMSKGNKVHVKFGVYRSFLSRFKDNNRLDKVPGQVVYFDEARTGKTCKKLKLEELSYNCKDLLVSQK